MFLRLVQDGLMRFAARRRCPDARGDDVLVRATTMFWCASPCGEAF